ncbi:MAG: hypothetical protein IIB71_04050 [Proteobacteria bacterium]|nr:hypothetical protein [Pseudomonadota bacterium]
MSKRSNIVRKSVGCLVLTVVSAAVPLTTIAELYKYKNEDGVTVLDSHVPARYVKYGYTILSLNGRVLEVVPRALTDAEITARDKAIELQQRIDRKRREQKIADQNLLRLYSTPEDVIRARDTKLRSIESFINAQSGNARRLQEQKHRLESSLADIERSGGTISKDRIDRIRSIENRMSQIENEIQGKHDEMEALRTTYAADLTRVRELYGNDPGR